MAPATAEGSELQNLSSNWKKLQEKLRAGTSNSPIKKRKATVPLNPQRSIKHTKLENHSSPSSKLHADKNRSLKMGPRSSRPQPQKDEQQQEKAPPSKTPLPHWATENDISAQDLHLAYGNNNTSTRLTTQAPDKVNSGLLPNALSLAGKYIALDCEMVGVGPPPHRESALARVSIVNYHGAQLYDSYVRTKETVGDYRTGVSGITPVLMAQARTLETVQADVASLMQGRVVVGHAIRHDLAALMLGHPKRDIRDTSRYARFRAMVSAAGGKSRTPGLKRLAREVLGWEIQGGEHSSVEDARATMALFRGEREGFERVHAGKWGLVRKGGRGEVDQVGGGEVGEGGGEESKRGGEKKKKKKKKKGKNS